MAPHSSSADVWLGRHCSSRCITHDVVHVRSSVDDNIPMRASQAWRCISHLQKLGTEQGIHKLWHTQSASGAHASSVLGAPYSAAASADSPETKQTNLCSAINDALHIALEQDPR